MPGTKGNIDHIAVGPAGVYIIDAKRYNGKIERRDVGSFFRSDERLFVDGRNRTKLVRQTGWQMEAVRVTLDGAAHPDVSLRAVLCFVESDCPLLFARPLHLQGVTVLWPKALQELVAGGDLLDAGTRDQVARDLAAGAASKVEPRPRGTMVGGTNSPECEMRARGGATSGPIGGAAMPTRWPILRPDAPGSEHPKALWRGGRSGRRGA